MIRVRYWYFEIHNEIMPRLGNIKFIENIKMVMYFLCPSYHPLMNGNGNSISNKIGLNIKLLKSCNFIEYMLLWVQTPLELSIDWKPCFYICKLLQSIRKKNTKTQ